MKPFDEDVLTRYIGMRLSEFREGEFLGLRFCIKGKVPLSGLYNDINAVIRDIKLYAGSYQIYISVNPIKLVNGMAINQLKATGKGESFSDNDVSRICCILVDVDSDRPTGTAASAGELNHAESVSYKIAQYLNESKITYRGYSSGNGYYIKIKVPSYLTSRSVEVRSFLRFLSKLFSTPEAKVDISVHNPSRICRVPGTLNIKGVPSIERPHRIAYEWTPWNSVVNEHDVLEVFKNLIIEHHEVNGESKNENFKTQNIKDIPFENIKEKLDVLLEENNNNWLLNATWYGNRTDLIDQSKSGHDMALAGQLAKLGFTPEETKAVLKVFPHGRGADGSEAYFNITVTKALASRIVTTEEQRKIPPLPKLEPESAAIFNKIYFEINRAPHLIEMSEVEESKPNFLFEPYILGDAVTLLAGDPGGGKSQIGLDYAARTSKEVGTVCIFSNEDKPGTIKKRLKNQGADPSKISLCFKEFDLSSDVGQKVLINFLGQKSPSLIVIDSLVSYSGDKDLNKGGDVRQIINFLNTVARYFKCAVLVILHLNKGDGKAIYKISGSTQIVAAARSVLIAGCKPKDNDDAEDDGHGAIFHIKANESIKGKPRGYSLGQKGVRWEETNLTLADIMGSDIVKTKDGPSALDEAKEFLEESLKTGPQKITEIQSEAKAFGIASITLRRAKDNLKIKTIPINSGGRGEGYGMWALQGDHGSAPNSMINDQVEPFEEVTI